MLQNIPEWIIKMVSDFICPQCNHSMNIDCVKGLGIRESHRDGSQTVLFLYYFCTNCQERTNIEIQSMTLEEFAIMIFEEINSDGENDVEDNSKDEEEIGFGSTNNDQENKQKTKISNKEFQDTIRQLKTMTYTDLARNLGIILTDNIEDNNSAI